MLKATRLIMVFCAVAGSVLPGAALASVVNDLYEAEVPVNGQGAQERSEAIRTALNQVLIKVTGDREISANPKVADLLDDAEKYVQQYRYRIVHDVPQAGLPETAVQQVLWVHFEPSAITGFLSAEQIPLWGRTRPATLLWLAVDLGDERYIVEGDRSDDLQKQIMQEASRRGIRVFLPLSDLEDQLNLSFADIWGNFPDPILKASQRYQADAVLVGRIYQHSPGNWVGRWSLYQGGKVTDWDDEGGDMSDVAGQGVDGLADTLAQRFAQVITETPKDSVLMEVTGVTGIDDYARVVKYLSGIDVVGRVQVQRISGSDVFVQLALRGDVSGLVQHISLGTTLAAVPASPLNPSSGDQALVYSLSP